MAGGRLRAVCAPRPRSRSHRLGARSSLVICVGAPKGAARLVQRIGRANHRLDEPSRRGCCVRPIASRYWNAKRARGGDGGANSTASGCAKAGWMCWRSTCRHGVQRAVDADALYAEVVSASPLSRFWSRADFDRVVRFVATALSLKALRLRTDAKTAQDGREGLWRLAIRCWRNRYRLNAGTIVEEPISTSACNRAAARPARAAHARPARGYFIEQLSPGAIPAVFAGEVLASRASARTRPRFAHQG